MMKRKLGYILVIVCWSIVATLLTSCEKYEFHEPVYEIPTIYNEWQLIETQHIYLDVNEIDGIAIMTDTDNSKMTAITYYQNIYFSAQ